MVKKIFSLNLEKHLFIISFLLLSVQVFAHGDLSIRIEKKTQEIKKNPKNFTLYFQRGLLYQQHREYQKALTDYDTSITLGNKNNALRYRISEAYYLSEDYKKALKNINFYLEKDITNLKGKKLEAQILFHLKAYKKSLKAYEYVVDNLQDIHPEDILEYTKIILSENNKNYKDALKAIEIGLDKLGENTLSLQLKKLDYLKESNQVEKVITQYNYFILEYSRKEFWYYKKAKYLAKLHKHQEANIALQLATINIEKLDAKFKKMNSTFRLKEQIKILENTINN
ncbi:tetratricopeptide repeat protein [Polaribacter sp. Asnod1-A03]|uniref:tetratricopeptide repeat protein n=1 Tax=Polaribacter sp. Asnod1-A03 TaxID=3160581 RepID=UPI0038630015